MNTYRSSRRDEAVANDYLGQHMPCRKCHAMTDREDLATFGGQCQNCYHAWCGEASPAWARQRLTVEQRRDIAQRVRAAALALRNGPKNPRAWAYELQSREQSGETLSAFQSWAWRQAIPASDQ